MSGPRPAAPRNPARVWGRDDLTCPVSYARIRRLIAHAQAHPWPGNQPLTDRELILDTTAITEPGRPTRIIYSHDVGYHESGWFANSDFAECRHLSVSHPRPERLTVRRPPANVGEGAYLGMDLDTPSDDEVRAWGRVLFGQHATKALFEPAASTLDAYRIPGVVHLRLWVDQQGQPIIPRGEVYHLRPWADGSSPPKITEGRLGADVR